MTENGVAIMVVSGLIGLFGSLIALMIRSDILSDYRFGLRPQADRAKDNVTCKKLFKFAIVWAVLWLVPPLVRLWIALLLV